MTICQHPAGNQADKHGAASQGNRQPHQPGRASQGLNLNRHRHAQKPQRNNGNKARKEHRPKRSVSFEQGKIKQQRMLVHYMTLERNFSLPGNGNVMLT